MHIVTVCLGNICRSPAAEAVLVHKLAEAGLPDVRVSSAGTADYHIGKRPHHLSVAEGERRGYSFTTTAAQFRPEMFDEADLVVAMDVANEEHLLAMARTREEAGKVVRLGAFADDAEVDVRDVADPWGHPEEAYTVMYDHLEEAVDGLIRVLRDDTLKERLTRYGSWA